VVYLLFSQRDFSKCRFWFNASINLIGVELLVVVLFSIIAPHVGYFLSYTMIGIMYKFFQLWPVDGFILDFESSSQPLTGESEFHI
jgi:hypothetical protein